MQRIGLVTEPVQKWETNAILMQQFILKLSTQLFTKKYSAYYLSKSCHPGYTDKILSQLTVWAPNGWQSEMWLILVSLTKMLFRCSNGG